MGQQQRSTTVRKFLLCDTVERTGDQDGRMGWVFRGLGGRVRPQVPCVDAVADTNREREGRGVLDRVQRHGDRSEIGQRVGRDVLGRQLAFCDDASLAVGHLPRRGLREQRFRTVMGYLNLRCESLGGVPNVLSEPRQRDGRSIPAANCLQRDSRFGAIETIQQPDQGLALARKIVQHEQLIPCQIRRAAHPFVLGFVLDQSELRRGLGAACVVDNAGIFRPCANALEVPGPHHTLECGQQ